MIEKVAGLRGVIGHLLREGAACGGPRTAKVCRKILEAEVHPWRFAEGVAPDITESSVAKETLERFRS